MRVNESPSIPPQPLPTYSSLAPFRRWFRHGTPVLMFHKLGPRPPGVRLKGLYVSEALFDRQLRELSEAGYTAPAYDEVVNSAPGGKRIFLTFDDGFENALKHGLSPMVNRKFRAIQFLVADRLGRENDWETSEGEAPEKLMDISQVNEWLAAGHEIGAHTLTHPRLTRVSEAQAREEIGASKRKLEDLFGRPVRHFCYPYGDHDERVEELVEKAGYSSACLSSGGLVVTGADPFRLNRIMARYASRSPGSLLRQLKAWWRAG
jgi:peptidoglycan/xylan/chitin deacetylase (PgdA/CDA1 family)